LPSVLADSGQLYQVFMNLITNAVEAMTVVTGRLCVLMVTSRVVPGSYDISVTVEDTGIGLPANDGGSIFEPFFSTKPAGTGIGLNICKVIIEGHGGSLSVSANQP